jgi:hypothetical protein
LPALKRSDPRDPGRLFHNVRSATARAFGRADEATQSAADVISWPPPPPLRERRHRCLARRLVAVRRASGPRAAQGRALTAFSRTSRDVRHRNAPELLHLPFMSGRMGGVAHEPAARRPPILVTRGAYRTVPARSAGQPAGCEPAPLRAPAIDRIARPPKRSGSSHYGLRRNRFRSARAEIRSTAKRRIAGTRC